MHSPAQKLLLCGLVAACVGLSLLAWRQHRQIRALHDRLSLAERDRATAAAAPASSRSTRLATDPADLRDRAPAGDPPETQPAAAGRRDWRRGRAGPPAGVLDSPEFQSGVAAGIRLGLDEKFAALFRRLQLPPQQLGRLKNLLVDKQAAAIDVMAAARADGLVGQAGAEGVRTLMERTQAEIDGHIRELLGDTAFAEFKDFEGKLPYYGVTGQLERRLSYSSEPLDAAQTEQLVQLLSATAPAPAPGGAGDRGFAAFGGGRAVLASTFGGPAAWALPGAPGTITDEAIELSSAFLTGGQIAAMREIQAEQQAMAAMFRLGRPPGPVPPPPDLPPPGP